MNYFTIIRSGTFTFLCMASYLSSSSISKSKNCFSSSFGSWTPSHIIYKKVMSSLSPKYVSTLMTLFFCYLSSPNYHHLFFWLTQQLLNWFHWFPTTVWSRPFAIMIFFFFFFYNDLLKIRIISVCHWHLNKTQSLYHTFQVFIESAFAHVFDLVFSFHPSLYSIGIFFCSSHLANLYLPRIFVFSLLYQEHSSTR